jgi:FAD/FMN-containing dehydrogenase/uncharacterized membrane protein YhaH (DUF805 family)
MNLFPVFFSRSGRLGRREFLYAIIAAWALFFALRPMLYSLMGGSFILLLFPLFGVAMVCICAKRFHDFSKSTWWILLLLVPILGPMWIALELTFRKGCRGENRYGFPFGKMSLDYATVMGGMDPLIINDVTKINPVRVKSVLTPTTLEEIQSSVKNSTGPISIGGGHFSMGGQTSYPDSIHLDLRKFNKVIRFSPIQRVIRVQAGIRWCDIQKAVDPYGLSVKIMQTYANFTVGGALSVNCHGRYIGQGPVILSVRSLLVVLANGESVAASPTQNRELFYGAIGGYGGLGIIVEVELDLAENTKVERVHRKTTPQEYLTHFHRDVIADGKSIFHNADVYPPHYRRMRSTTWRVTDEEVTHPERLMPLRRIYPVNRYFFWAFTETFFGLWRREHLIEPVLYWKKRIHWRNYEAGYDVAELEPSFRTKSTYVLQEYFVPIERFVESLAKMAEVLNRHQVKVVNISIRHAITDPGSILAWARQETFAFVLYYKQGVSEEEKSRVAIWTRELIDVSIGMGGTYYLPYQPHATLEQFKKAYPRAEEFFEIKRRLDPGFRFRNSLWSKYYQPENPS